MTDIDLLELEIDTIWARNSYGRLIKSRDGGAAPHVVVAAATDGQIAAIGVDVPDDLAAKLRAAVAGAEPPIDPAATPASLRQCRQLLAAWVGPTEVSAGPSYVIPPATELQSTAEIVRSGYGQGDAVRELNPAGANWTAEEWSLLFDGRLGPWAAAMEAGQVVAICHSARLTDRGAEAGVWTDPRFRGRGHAAAVTAAWASLLAPSGRRLFYSTSADNLSSQRVAARLRLRLIGWLWKLSSPGGRAGA